VAAHTPVNARDATPVLRAGVPRVGEDKDAPRDGALLGRTEEAMFQQQPACHPALCYHWSVMGSPNCVSARPEPRQSQVGGAGARAVPAPGSEPGGLGSSASSPSAPSPCAAAQGGVAAVLSLPAAR